MCELLAGAVGGGGTIQPDNERTDHIIVSTQHSTALRSITALSPVFWKTAGVGTAALSRRG